MVFLMVKKTMGHIVKTGNISIGQGSQLVLISGPCVIENYETTFQIASFLKELTAQLNIPFIFKASYDKANRTSIHSFRGPGLMDGLKILDRIKSELDLAIISDVHRISEIADAANVLDIKDELALISIELNLSDVSYLKLKELLPALETNLRLLDVQDFNFSPIEGTLSLSLRAYYLN